MLSVLQQRFHQPGSADLTSDLRLREGTLKDYAVLCEHHYRAARPATATRVLVYEDPTPEPTARFRNETAKPRVVAVLVESLPSLSCRMRDYALHDRYGTHLEPAGRALMLNEEVRCISRVVVDPRWRGLGLAVGLVRQALETATTRYTEALAAMGRVHPFFERAGMTAFPRPAHETDLRMIDVLRRVGLGESGLSDLEQAWVWIDSLPHADRIWLLRELNAWYRKNVGRGGGYDRDPQTHLAKVRERLRLEPVYYLFDRQNSGRSA